MLMDRKRMVTTPFLDFDSDESEQQSCELDLEDLGEETISEVSQ